MEAELVFSLASGFVVPGWLALIFLPRWRPGPRLLAGIVMPLVLGILYAILFLLHFGGAAEGAGFGSLEGVGLLFSDPWVLLVGWIHYLAFDLFVGAWEVRDAQRIGIPHLAVVPCLVLTFFAGPIGLALYLLIRGLWKKRWNAESGAPA